MAMSKRSQSTSDVVERRKKELGMHPDLQREALQAELKAARQVEARRHAAAARLAIEESRKQHKYWQKDFSKYAQATVDVAGAALGIGAIPTVYLAKHYTDLMKTSIQNQDKIWHGSDGVPGLKDKLSGVPIDTPTPHISYVNRHRITRDAINDARKLELGRKYISKELPLKMPRTFEQVVDAVTSTYRNNDVIQHTAAKLVKTSTEDYMAAIHLESRGLGKQEVPTLQDRLIAEHNREGGGSSLADLSASAAKTTTKRVRNSRVPSVKQKADAAEALERLKVSIETDRKLLIVSKGTDFEANGRISMGNAEAERLNDIISGKLLPATRKVTKTTTKGVTKSLEPIRSVRTALSDLQAYQKGAEMLKQSAKMNKKISVGVAVALGGAVALDYGIRKFRSHQENSLRVKKSWLTRKQKYGPSGEIYG
jgi:hypothetical protein